VGDPAMVPVAIERPDGRLVDALLAAGYPVVPVKPNAIKTWREGEVISGEVRPRGRGGDRRIPATARPPSAPRPPR
jgi:hypothetical protein